MSRDEDKVLSLVFFVLAVIGIGVWLFFVVKEADASKFTCEERIEQRIEKISTQLRLRTAELTVNRGMLRAANKKLEQCASAE